MGKEILIHVQNLCKNFGSTKAVDDVTLDIYKGEIRGLIGENGSGKSTLTSMISGIHSVTSGTMYLEGREYHPENQLAANRNGITVILQEMGTLSGLTVADNIFFGNEDQFIKLGIKNIKAMNKRADEYLHEYHFDYIKASETVETYNFEQRKLIEMLKATYLNPKLLVIDETTTALSQNGRQILYDLMRKMKAAGNTVIFISHDLEEILSMCDTVTVLRDGKYIDTLKNTGLTEEILKAKMVGRELTEKYYRDDYNGRTADEVVLEVKDINLKGKLNNVSLELHRGEILGIGGLSESGLHDIGKVIFGAETPDSGHVKLLKGNTEIKGISQAISLGLGYVSKNRDEEALINNASIADNVTISCMDLMKKHGLISPGKEKKFAEENVHKLDLKMENIDQRVSALSGGNKQKVALTKWLSRNSEIFVLDSPTRGIDIMVKSKIYRIMEELKAQGKSIIMISEELMELIGMSDRILIFKDGKISYEFSRSEDLDEETIIQKMI